MASHPWVFYPIAILETLATVPLVMRYERMRLAKYAPTPQIGRAKAVDRWVKMIRG